MVYIKTYMFNNFYKQYLVLLTMAPRNSIYLKYAYMGWGGVGWRRRCKTRLSLRELLIDSQGTGIFSSFLLAITAAGG